MTGVIPRLFSSANCLLQIRHYAPYQAVCIAMFLVNVLAGEIPSAAHYILSKLACNSSTPPQKDRSNPLSTLKFLAHWALHVASSTKPLLFNSQYDNRVQQEAPKRTFSLIKHTSTASTVSLIWASSITGPNASVGTSHTRQRISLLVFYTVDKLGTFQLVGSLYFCTSYQAFEHSRRLSYESPTQIKTFPRSRQKSLGCIFYFLTTSAFSNAFKLGRRTFSWHINNGPERKMNTPFGFLRYNGPRRLRSSRRVVLDVDDYQITHIGQGAFAVISRVVHRPSREVRVMKRITFDNTGLAEYLARNEVDALKAMSGNAWFPRLLNNFEEGGEFLITMVRRYSTSPKL